MPYGMYLSAAGADAQSRRLEVLSNNLANVDTPGFKRQFAILQARHSESIERGEDVPGSRSINDVGGGIRADELLFDTSAGAMKKTGVPTDMAINDDGRSFFVVEKDGRRMLTRAGNFRLSPTGVLQTDGGYRVLAQEGDPITLDPSLPPPHVTKNGVVTQGTSGVPLRLVRPRSLADLARAGENLFAPLADVPLVPEEERSVIGGYLEMSTVRPAQEMMQLIEATRAYEANIRMIQNQDQMLGSLVNRVLRQS